MLTVTALSVHYGGVAAVKRLNLHVRAGEIVGLIGPNGAGKSTTLRTIAGLLRPSSGRIQYAQENVTAHHPEQLVRSGLVLVPEGRHVFGSLTIEENLRLAVQAAPTGSNHRWRDSIADILDLFPVLSTQWRTPAGKLSGGEQQQLAIARALVSRPRLLLLDEPSLGLAPRLVDEIFKLVGDLRSGGMTVLLVEQNASRTLQIADRAYVMRAGLIVMVGSGKELREGRAIELENAYLGASVEHIAP